MRYRIRNTQTGQQITPIEHRQLSGVLASRGYTLGALPENQADHDALEGLDRDAALRSATIGPADVDMAAPIERLGPPRADEFETEGAFLQAVHAYAERHFGELRRKREDEAQRRVVGIVEALAPRSGFVGNYFVEPGALKKALWHEGGGSDGKGYEIHPDSTAGREIRRAVALEVATPVVDEIAASISGIAGETGPLTALVRVLQFMLREGLIRA